MPAHIGRCRVLPVPNLQPPDDPRRSADRIIEHRGILESEMPPQALELQNLRYREPVMPVLCGKHRQKQRLSSSLRVNIISIQGSKLNVESPLLERIIMNSIRDGDQVLCWVHIHIGNVCIGN